MGFFDWIFHFIAGGSRSSQSVTPVGKVSAATDSVATATASASAEGDDTPWWSPPGADLLTLVAPERPGLSPEEMGLDRLLEAHGTSDDLELPTIPHVAERVLSSLRNENYRTDEIAEQISRDQVIAATVLRTANSVLYAGSEKVSSIKVAVSRLGANVIRRLMLQQSLHAATFNRKTADRELTETVWRRSVASAHVMSGLAKLVCLDENDAFVTGLLHDIGNVIVLREAQEQQAMLRYRVDLDAFEYLCHRHNERLGARIAAGWGLPERLSRLISDHHAPPAADDPQRVERWALQLTDMICALLGFSPTWPYRLLESEPVHELGLASRGDFVALLAKLPQQLDEEVLKA
ncbi:MAG: hypothetical protein CHACPFDD_02195 [Phycisphaerae bacterium]|nr:hypothetical protein [Phycisphaerae bacterium]